MLGFIVLLLILPTQFAFANDNVLNCIENPDECKEDGSFIDDNKGGESESKPAVGVTAWDYTKTIFALIFVVALLFGLLKFINSRNRLYDKNRLMKNMGGLSLGQHKSIQLVHIGNTYYLIGVGEEIRLLKEITDQEEIETLVQYYEQADGEMPTGLLNGFLTKMMARKESKLNKMHDNSKVPQDFSNIFNTRLDEMKEERKRRLSQMTEKERDQDE